jgi:uncharacterized protein GlcG (DUF336 family)
LKNIGEEIMGKPAIAFAVAALAGLSCWPAAAQGLIREQRLSAALVNEALGVAVATCAGQGYKVSAVVVDMDGVRQGVLRGDGAPIHTPDSAFQKAYTSATYRQDTIVLAERLKNGQMSILQQKLPYVTIAAGGVSIQVDGVAVGAIGVGGAPGGEKDTACARAGLEKIKDRMK